MQELLRTDRNQTIALMSGAIAHLKIAEIRPHSTALNEAVDDLSELAYLVDDLESGFGDECSVTTCQAPPFAYIDLREALAVLRARLSKGIDMLERASRWGNSEHLTSLISSARREYLEIKSTLRLAYRHRGVMRCAADWQSPVYWSSFDVRQNRLSQGISEHSWDYKRDGHLDAVEYETTFMDQYCDHLGSGNLSAYLANSGMAAFTTVLHWLAHEMRLGQSTFVMQPMYFENVHLVRSVFPNAISINHGSKEDLLANLRNYSPSIVFCDAVTNCGEVVSQDFETVLHWAAEEANHQLAIVIDTTCLPAVLLPPRFLTGLPDNVTVLLVESLAKHHQFGMDTVTGGIVVAHMDGAAQDSFRKTRARLGTNISDSSVGSLPQPSRLRLIRRMQRHAHNIRFLAETLERHANTEEGPIEAISWLKDGVQALSWYRGTCLTLRLKKAFRSMAYYREFEKKVLELAKSNGHPVAFSTSFGFDVSRLYVTAPSTVFEEPFLRISVGTETKSQIECLVEILIKASLQLAGKSIFARTEKPAPPPENTSMIALAPPLPATDNLSRQNVFLGNDALKNYLCPSNYTVTPLVELPPELNPFANDGVKLLAKVVPLVPLMNIKSIPAFSMLKKADERGELKDVERIIESSSSNTVLSLSVMAKLFGIGSTTAIVDHSIAPSLVRMLQLFGIEIILHPGPGHELYDKVLPRSERAAEYGSRTGWLNPGQYSNPDNPAGFERWLAPEIWSQTGERLSLLSCGLGTCGTMVGVSRGLRKHKPDLEVIACCPTRGEPVPGPRDRSQLSDVSFAWQDVANAQIELSAKDSFAASVRLLRMGIFGGPSSGMNYAGAVQYLQAMKDSGLLKKRVSRSGELWCVFLCCDSPMPHVDEYFEALGKEFFPPIHGIKEGDLLISGGNGN